MKVTFTGIDIKTTRDQIKELLSYEFVELGILYSANPRNRNRYPEKQQITNILTKIDSPNIALHICGSTAFQELYYGDFLKCIIPNFNRIQINGIYENYYIEGLCQTYNDIEFITQYNDETTFGSLNYLNVPQKNHSILLDNSAGKGIRPDNWNFPPKTDKKIGFAGGITPNNVKDILEEIQSYTILNEHSWIDMESGVRNSFDWFDFEKALSVVKVVEKFNEENNLCY